MGTSEIDASEVIWGTNVNTTAVAQNFKKFFREFNKEGRLVYIDLLEDLVESQVRHNNFFALFFWTFFSLNTKHNKIKNKINAHKRHLH